MKRRRQRASSTLFRDSETAVTPPPFLTPPVCLHLSVSTCLFPVCLSAEDHLAQAQVCESLAECYLRQRKQQKAVKLYKQALTSLSHCQVTVTQLVVHMKGSEVITQ